MITKFCLKKGKRKNQQAYNCCLKEITDKMKKIEVYFKTTSLVVVLPSSNLTMAKPVVEP